MMRILMVRFGADLSLGARRAQSAASEPSRRPSSLSTAGGDIWRVGDFILAYARHARAGRNTEPAFSVGITP